MFHLNHSLRRILLSSPVKGACLFTVLGPPIGCGIVVAMLLCADTSNLGTADGGPVTLGVTLTGALVFAALSYGIVIVPAAATGLLAGALRDKGRLSTLRHCIFLAILGALLSTGYGVWRIFQQDGLEPAIIMLGLPGLLSSLCCAWLFRAPQGRQ